ncbi:hypothetical protein BIW11_11663 [Tropilaelaps mercedesae]|uniref:Uncharacterized protein n=1 Tax=Tropilaelaps mercedesae TaxID=418985 RepID=A0A1V9XAJ7_9ACAR|nr:hypothetical protein BIW11_11663 [Tropilaelaps mercedesae]
MFAMRKKASITTGFISDWKYNELLCRIEAISNRLEVAKQSYYLGLVENPNERKLPGVLRRLPPNKRRSLTESYLKDMAHNENRLLDALRLTVTLHEANDHAANLHENEVENLIGLQRRAEDIITFMEQHHVRYRVPA